MEDMSTDYLRKHLGEVFDEVRLANKQFVVKRKGKEIGAIVPVELFRRLRRAARDNLAELLEARRGVPIDISDEELTSRAAEEVASYRRRER